MTFNDRLKKIINAAAEVTGIPKQVSSMARELAPMAREISRVDRGSQLLLALRYKELGGTGRIPAI